MDAPQWQIERLYKKAPRIMDRAWKYVPLAGDVTIGEGITLEKEALKDFFGFKKGEVGSKVHKHLQAIMVSLIALETLLPDQSAPEQERPAADSVPVEDQDAALAAKKKKVKAQDDANSQWLESQMVPYNKKHKPAGSAGAGSSSSGGTGTSLPIHSQHQLSPSPEARGVTSTVVNGKAVYMEWSVKFRTTLWVQAKSLVELYSVL